MKCIRVILIAVIAMISSALLAQSKGEMPFTSSSPEAKKLLRQAWVAYGDAKFDEASGFVRQALEKDPEFGLAHAFIQTDDKAGRERNLKKASGCPLSPDEKLLIDGLRIAEAHEPVADYFEPLLTKYPKDYYLNLWLMFNYHNGKRSAEIGEMIIKRNPKFAPAYNMLGYEYMTRGDLKNAEANFNKYLSLRPDLANAYDSKADYLMRVGKVEEAAGLFEKAGEMGMAPSTGRADVAKAKLKYPGPSDKDKLEIKNIISASSAAYLTGNVDEILRDYSDQAMELFPNQMINAGLGNVRSRLREPFKYGSFTRMNKTVESIEGTGPIAVAWGHTESAFKSNSDGKIYEDVSDDIFMLRKQEDGQWKILTHHWVTGADDVSAQPSEDSLSIRQVIDKWSFFIKPGEILSQEHVENLAAIHSAQGVDIRQNQRSIIGMANLRLLWTGFIGIKWAQFTDYSFDVNSFAAIGPEGFAQRAVAWGIGDHSNYWNGTDAYAQFLFPWAMILTKEKDGKWRILVYHFYTG
jgi:ketosteroid isomerase-like protein